MMRISDCAYPKITPVRPCAPSFQGFKLKNLSLADIFVRGNLGLYRITGIKPGKLGGTICKGSVPMRNFWSNFTKDEVEKLKKKGRSTNKDGFPSCFLKTKSNVPISTSFIHDCSAMYLYNKKTKTHMLYHAAYNVSKDTLDSVMKILMPESFTTGIIVPGSSDWYDRHEDNLNNMFELMKKHNPDAKVNVYHDSSWFPEVVGYEGEVFEIPNKDVIEQRKQGYTTFDDYGQASFRIVDAQSYNTFDKIVYNCNYSTDGEVLKKEFKKRFPKEMFKPLANRVDEKVKILKEIETCNDLEILEGVEKLLKDFNGFKEALRSRYEKLLLQELDGINTPEELGMFYEKASCYEGFNYMKDLLVAIQKKEDKLLR